MSDADNVQRWRKLFRKEQAGTITASESVALREHCDAITQQMFNACPICRGAFSLYAARTQTFLCPNCAVELAKCSGDILPHQPHEVDDSIAEHSLLGEFAAWYYPIGCSPCACGVKEVGYYPAPYTCCPSLLALAAEMYASGNHKAYRFLCAHSDTLINALRGDFYSIFHVDHLTRFIQDPQQPASGPMIAKILNDRAAR